MKDVSRLAKEVALLLAWSLGVFIVCVSSKKRQVRTKVSAVITEVLKEKCSATVVNRLRIHESAPLRKFLRSQVRVQRSFRD